MPRSYQRARAATLVASLIAGACGSPDAPLPPPPVETPDPARIAASATYEPVGLLAGGEWAIANEIRDGRTRAVRLRRDAATPQPLDLLAATSVPSRALALAAGGTRVAVEVGHAGSPTALVLVDGTGTVEARVAFAPGERLVAVADDATRLWTATPEGSGDRLAERSLPSGSARPAPAVPRGFDVAAMDGRGERVVLRRTVEPGRDEIVLFERTSGVATLLLPADRDGTFAPLALDAGGDRLLVAAREVERAPRLLAVELATGGARELPIAPCDATAARPFDGGGWIVRRRCDDGVRIEVGGATGEPPAPPAAGVRWRDLVPLEDGGWLGAAAAPGAPADLWWVGATGDRRPLTWGLEPRLDPRALPVPETVVVTAGERRLLVEHWPAVGRPNGSVLFLRSARPGFRPGGFDAIPSALAASGVESHCIDLPEGVAPSPELVDELVAGWSAIASSRRRTLVGGSGAAASAVLARARRNADPPVVAVAPHGSWNPDPEASPAPLRAPATLLVDRTRDLSDLAIELADPRLSALRTEIPSTPGEWPRALLELSFEGPEAP